MSSDEGKIREENYDKLTVHSHSGRDESSDRMQKIKGRDESSDRMQKQSARANQKHDYHAIREGFKDYAKTQNVKRLASFQAKNKEEQKAARGHTAIPQVVQPPSQMPPVPQHFMMREQRHQIIIAYKQIVIIRRVGLANRLCISQWCLRTIVTYRPTSTHVWSGNEINSESSVF